MAPRPIKGWLLLTLFFSQLAWCSSVSIVEVNHEPFDDSDYVLEKAAEDDDHEDPVESVAGAELDEQNLVLKMLHKNGSNMMANLEMEDDCIYSGYMVGCSTSTVILTGCNGELQGVQIQSVVFGDMLFNILNGSVLPMETSRYKRDLDPEVDYDYDDSIENPEFELGFADLDNAEIDSLSPPPPVLTVNVNVYLDRNWRDEFGKTGSQVVAKRILRQAAGFWEHQSLSTKIEIVTNSDEFYTSPRALHPSQTNLNKVLPGLLEGPNQDPDGMRRAHLYLTADSDKKSRLLGLSRLNGMCGLDPMARLMVNFKQEELRTAMTVAHELGHLLGLEHDFVLGKRQQKCGAGKTSGGTIMNYGKNRDRFSSCSNTDFMRYYNRVVLEKGVFCLREAGAAAGCACNGFTDGLGLGGKCTQGLKGDWCYVNKSGCKDEVKFNGKFTSTTPCNSEPTSPTRTTRQPPRRTTRGPVQSSQSSSLNIKTDLCDYNCKAGGSCSVKYVGLTRSGPTSGSCFPQSFGGSCSGTPPECNKCNQVLTCPE